VSPIQRSFKYKRWFKSLRSKIEILLNQSHNKYRQDTICMKIVKSQSLRKESVSYIFFTYSSKNSSRDNSRIAVHALMIWKCREERVDVDVGLGF
jgi:hypothetical protein